MVGAQADGLSTVEQNIPSAEEIESGVRERVGRLSGEELIASLTEYIVLSMVEVRFFNSNPTRITQLGEEQVEVVRTILGTDTPLTRDSSDD